MLTFTLQGKHGPMTVALQPMGRHPFAPVDVTEEQAQTVTQEEVQHWYERHAHPVRGTMVSATPRTRRPCGVFKMV